MSGNVAGDKTQAATWLRWVLRSGYAGLWICLLLGGFAAGTVRADTSLRAAPARQPAPAIPASKLDSVRYEQKLGSQLPMGARLVDSRGRPVSLGEATDGLPGVLVFGYYRCEKLCHILLHRVALALDQLALDQSEMAGTPSLAANDYSRIAISIDPRDTPRDASELRRDLAGGEQWRLLTTQDQATLDQLTQQAGFHYFYDTPSDQFVHPAGILFFTPAGTISSYLLGIEFSQAKLRQALREAQAEQLGSPMQNILLRCYRYLEHQGLYNQRILMWLKVAGVITLVLMAWMIFRISRPQPRDR